MIRVLLVMTAREVGGAEIYVERLVRALDGRCTFTVILSDHPQVQTLCNTLNQTADVRAAPFDRSLALPAIARMVQRCARQHNIVQLNSNHPGSRLGIAMGFVLGAQPTPFITVEQRVTPLDDIVVPRLFSPILPPLFRASRRRAAKLIAVSKQNAALLEHLYGIPERQIAIVPNGVPVSADTPNKCASDQSLHAELGLRADQPLVLVLARLQGNKGHRYLIDAAPAILEHCPAAHFVFAGLPDDRWPLDTRIQQLGLAHKFTILGARSDVPRLLGASSLFVLPSLAEGFSLALIEALAAGVPTVATAVGGAPEVIQDGINGWLVPPADTSALAQAIIRALNMTAGEKAALSARAAAAGRRYSVEAMADATLAIYRAVLALTHRPNGETGDQ